MKIGLIADPQYCDCDPSGTRFYRETLSKLPKAIDTLEKYDVNFVVNLGDLIDKYENSYDSVARFYENISMPYYNILGNHAFSSVSETYMNTLLDRYNMPDYYYNFSYNNWRFVMLDGTELAGYSRYLHPELAGEGDSLWMLIQDSINGYTYNGGIGRKQQQWLDSVLTQSLVEEQNVILFCHFPLLPDTLELALWNYPNITKIIERYPNVVAYINGHEHQGSYAFEEGIHYITQKAMVETPDINSFAILEIYPRELKINGFGNISDTLLAYDNVNITPVSFDLSDTLLYYSDHLNNVIGIFTPDDPEYPEFEYFVDTSLLDNRYFTIRSDSLILNTENDLSSLSPLRLEVITAGCMVDTSYKEFHLTFDTMSVQVQYTLDDSLLSLYTQWVITKDSLVLDHSRNGLQYTVQINDNNILSANELDSVIILSPLKVGNTDIEISITDNYTGQSENQMFNIEVYDPLNHTPYVNTELPLSYNIYVSDTLKLYMNRYFIDPDNDTLDFFYTLSNTEEINAWITDSILCIYASAPNDISCYLKAIDCRGGGDSAEVTIHITQAPLFLSDDYIEEDQTIFQHTPEGIMIRTGETDTGYSYEIIDGMGRVIIHGPVTKNFMPVSGLPGGLYFIRISSASGTVKTVKYYYQNNNK